MAGGAGFSLSGNHSLEDNRNLGKIRPNPTASNHYDYPSKMHLVNLKYLDEGIKFRIERKEQSDKIRKWIFRILWILGISLGLLLFIVS